MALYEDGDVVPSLYNPPYRVVAPAASASTDARRSVIAASIYA